MSNVRANSYYDYSGGSNAVLYGVAAPANSMGFRNRLINSDMRIDQRNAGASVTPTDGQYLVDRWVGLQAAASKYSAQRNAGGVTPPTGFTNYLGVTSLSAYSVGASEYFGLRQSVEGFNVADLAWGTSSAQPITISFWVRSSLTGTFGGALQNAASNRFYAFTYGVSSANTWEYKTVTVAGDTSGAWATDNTAGLRLTFGIGVGSTFSISAGSWRSTPALSATGATSVVGTNGATFYITGVQLEAGSVASPFERVDYGRQLAMCQRYYAKLTSGSSNFTVFGSGYLDSTTVGYFYVKYPTTMRATPTANFSTLQLDYSGGAGTVTSISGLNGGSDSAQVSFTCSGGGLTATRASNVRSLNSTAGYIDFAAEL